MKITVNYGLKKPDGTDLVNIEDLNSNADVIDTKLNESLNHTADGVKHITSAERTAWNGKANTAVATTAANGLMAAADKVKLTSIAVGANKTVVVNNLTATAAGNALDAVQGKALDNKITAVNQQLTVVLASWSAARTYVENDLVMDDGTIYKSLQVGNKNHAVTDSAWWVQYGRDSVPSYDQIVNYTMLYDQGNECTPVTGGWEASAPTDYDFCAGASIAKNNTYLLITNTPTANTEYQLSHLSPIDFSQYALMGACYEAQYTCSGGNIAMWCTSQKYKRDRRILPGCTLIKKFGTTSYKKYSLLCDISAVNESGYFSTGNYAVTTKYYEIFLALQDDWQQWATIGGLAASNYTSLDALLSNEAAMTTLMSSPAAIEYMIKRCTGTVMAGVCNNATAADALVNNIAYDAAFANEHWRKFLVMCPVSLVAMDSVAVTVPTMTSNMAPKGEVLLFGWRSEGSKKP